MFIAVVAWSALLCAVESHAKSGLCIEVQNLTWKVDPNKFEEARVSVGAKLPKDAKVVSSIRFDVEVGKEQSAEAKFGDRTLTVTTNVRFKWSGFLIRVSMDDRRIVDSQIPIFDVQGIDTTVVLSPGQRLCIGGFVQSISQDGKTEASGKAITIQLKRRTR